MPGTFLAKLAKARFTIRALIALVAIVAICLGDWREYWSPRRVWRRAIHAPKSEWIEYTNMWGHPNNPPKRVFQRSIIWPISRLRIEGLDEVGSFEELELALADPDAAIRKELFMLVANETAAMTRPVAIRLLTPGLVDREEVVRLNAVRGLQPFIRPEDPFAPRFFDMLEDPSPLVRQYAVLSICEVVASIPDRESPSTGTPSRNQRIATVLARLNDPAPEVQEATIDGIEFLFQHDPHLAKPLLTGVNGRTLLDALELRLGDATPCIRAMAAFVLAKHGRGLEAVPMLIDFAKEPARLFCSISRLSRAIGNWAPENALTLLADRSDEAASYFFDRLGIFDTGTPSEPWQRLVRIASQSPEGRSRIERLAIQRIVIRHSYVQAQIAMILQEIGSSRDVLPELIEGAISAFDHIHRDSIRALQARLTFDPRVLPRLREATRDPMEYNAMRATQALEAVEATPTRPMPDG